MTETIRIRPWEDPVIDTIGHDPRSVYPEKFWLPTLGPTALLLLRHLAARFDVAADGFALDVAETSRCLGLGERESRNSPLMRSFGRLVQFDLAAPADETPVPVLAVRRRLPPVNRRHVRRLPPCLADEHDRWVNARLAEPPLTAARGNARRMALILFGTGDGAAEVERTLASTGFHPALCEEATEWAWQKLNQDPGVAVGVGGLSVA